MAASLRFSFVSEWLDPASGVLWKYQFFYYPDTKEVEMVSWGHTSRSGLLSG
jgi:hypothetical protein